MTEPEKVTQGGEGKPSNPPTEETANPSSKQSPQPQNEPGSSADLTKLKAQLDEMNQKLERYKEQVKGSSEEALRLKEENEKLSKRIEEMEKSGNSVKDEGFQKIMEDQGLQAAIDWMISKEVASLQARVDTFEKKDAKAILEKFKTTHKGLEDPEVLKRFDVEFDRLKDVYQDVSEAMEKAYILAGGAIPKAEKVEDPQKKANEEKVVKNVTGGEEDSRPTKPSSDEQTSLQKQINDLQYEAMLLSNQGRTRQAAELLTKADELQARLTGKV
jgi:hypothetical protein